ncbi:MAG TPA: hypothetical protein DDW50_18910 [Firmicutes bacterium]|jgi:hypothetical protein|nr:hypothetical protein [Bacillota bacterium]
MKLKLILISFLVVLLGLSFWFTFNYIRNKGTLKIEIYNKTSEAIGDLKFTYQKNDKDIVISGIPAESYLKLIFKPQETLPLAGSGENAMWLSYQDKNGEKHKEVIFGYFERGYHGKALIKITKVEPDGVIKFEIKSDVKN